jgi:hypothetical protein
MESTPHAKEQEDARCGQLGADARRWKTRSVTRLLDPDMETVGGNHAQSHPNHLAKPLGWD